MPYGVQPYVSLATLKAALDKTGTTDDATLTLALAGASRFIDQYTGRAFDQIAEARRFDVGGPGAHRLHVDDFAAVTELAYIPYWNATPQVRDPQTYYPGPDARRPGWPYRWIDLAQTYLSSIDIVTGVQWFPEGTRTVRVTATWGWPAVPADIQQACLSLAARFWKAAKAGFNDTIGVDATGAPQFSRSISSLDRLMLDEYRIRRLVIA